MLLAVALLASTAASTVMPFLPNQTSTFNLSEYCSLYRNQFNVTYCPAETTTQTGLLNLSAMSSIQIGAIVVAAVIMLSGVIVLMIDRRTTRSLSSRTGSSSEVSAKDWQEVKIGVRPKSPKMGLLERSSAFGGVT